MSEQQKSPTTTFRRDISQVIENHRKNYSDEVLMVISLMSICVKISADYCCGDYQDFLLKIMKGEFYFFERNRGDSNE